ncbi:uncharacterized protein [Onthophagus taurus]|uniref:uncharacterized protein n=1 Tax=Onthophagus taurus TaxID=166361 RepID=UPI0039BEC169
METNSLYSVEEINNLLELLKIDTNQIQNLICNEQKNLQCLKLALQIYNKRNKEENIEKFAFPSIEILNKRNTHNISIICDILKLSAELQFELELSHMLQNIKNLEFNNENELLVDLQLVSTFIKHENVFDDSFIIFLRHTISTQNLKAATNYFITDILKPYLHLTLDTKEIVLKDIVTSLDLYMISCLIQEIPSAIFNESFFLHLQCVFYNKPNQWEYKLAVNIMKYFIKSIQEDNFSTTLDVIKGETTNFGEFRDQWESFFTLIEASEEKQLHLVEPSLNLLKNIDKLAFIWVQCVFEKLLNHMQLSVVYKTASFILDFKLISINDYKDCIKSLLLGINKNDFSEYTQNFFKNFHSYVLKIEPARYRIILEESAKINWTPFAAWLFYNHCTKRFSSFILSLSDFEIIKSILHNLEKLPHRYIRNGCFDLFFKKLKYHTEILDIFKSFNNKYFPDTQNSSKTIECNVEDTAYVLLNPDNYDESTIASVYTYYKDSFVEVKYTDQILDFWKKRIEKGNVSPRICKPFLGHLCCHIVTYCSSNITYTDVEDALEKMISTQSNEIFEEIYKNLHIFMLICSPDALPTFVIRWFRELENIKCYETQMNFTSMYFEEFFNYYNLSNDEVCSIIFDSIYQNDQTLFSYLSKLPIDYYKDHFDNLLKGLYFGDGLTKHKKYEDEICYQIFLQDGVLNCDTIPSLETAIRLSALKACLYAIETNPLLLWKLLELPKKRYFPNSPDHIRYLRSAQAVLILTKYKTLRTPELFDVILKRLINDSHQTSVRQLMQWILIRLCSLCGRTEFCILIEKFQSQQCESTLTSLIVVLYHIGFIRKAVIKSVIDVVLEHTMGPVFKLRVYSQVAIYNLIKRQNLQQEYKVLFTVLEKTLESNKTAVNKVLNTDLDIFEVFDPIKHFHWKTILVDIPKLNNVIDSEWCYIEHYMKKNESFNDLLPMGEHRSEFLPLSKTNFLNNLNEKENMEMDVINIQKKIVPNHDILNNSKVNTDLIVIASLVTSSANLGGLARTCEIYGVKKLIVHNLKVTEDKEFKSLSMSSERWLNIEEVKSENLINYITKEKVNGYAIIGAEQTCDSVKLNDYKFPSKSILVLGNEKKGIPFSLLPHLDVCLEIPQFGVVRSLNVHVAGSTFIWEYVKQISLQ